MSRYRHCRTLDAIELRGFTPTKARDTRVGDIIGSVNERFDYVVEGIETDAIGGIRHRTNSDTLSCCYWPDEYVYVKRDTP